MKISAAAFLLASTAGSASAFAPSGASATRRSASALPMSDPQWGDDDGATRAGVLDTEPQGFAAAPPTAGMIGEDAPPSRPKAPAQSIAIPFAKCPPLLNGEMAGDVGFDPLGFADSRANLNNYREAEIKHARLAMLAAAGWPLSELWDKPLANVLGMDPVVDAAGRVPSVLNGGMGKIGIGYWVGCLGLAAAMDVYGSFFASKKNGYVPGDLGFDPFGMYPKDEKGRKRMHLSEIKHGRVAMVAITAFAFQEFAAGTAVIDQAPFFFKPIWQVLSESVPGYYIPEEATTAAVEAAASSVSEAASATASDISAASDFAASAVVEAVPPAPIVDAVPPPPAPVATPDAVAQASTIATPPAVETASPSAQEELAAAKLRIAQLESQLRQINGLTQQ